MDSRVFAREHSIITDMGRLKKSLWRGTRQGIPLEVMTKPPKTFGTQGMTHLIASKRG